MDEFKLPFSVKIDENTFLDEIDLTIPEAVALNNLEASQSDIQALMKLFKQMTIGKKILLERCARYEELKKFGSAKDILQNEKALIEKSTVDFIKIKEKFARELEAAS